MEMVEHLVGMQAQVPENPYVALWSRLEGFGPSELSGAIEQRRAVRGGLMRGTLHLATDDDFLAIWPLIRPGPRPGAPWPESVRSGDGGDRARSAHGSRPSLARQSDPGPARSWRP